jgi:methylated-DNA-[protein]-cysteine S-methyltransferase
VPSITIGGGPFSRWTLPTPVGTLQLFATDDALAYLSLPDRAGPIGTERKTEVLAAAAAQLDEYFAGKRRTFDLPMTLDGTEFQRTVWRALADVPYGETCTYGELARVIGRPSASRAVGAANGANPIAIILPCHRVIGSNGTLTGYGGGLPLKKKLLAMEQGAGPLFRSERA